MHAQTGHDPKACVHQRLLHRAPMQFARQPSLSQLVQMKLVQRTSQSRRVRNHAHHGMKALTVKISDAGRQHRTPKANLRQASHVKWVNAARPHQAVRVVRWPTPKATPTLSRSTKAAPAKVAAYWPASIKLPKISGEIAKPVSRPEYTKP